MRDKIFAHAQVRTVGLAALVLCVTTVAHANDIYVPAGGNLQKAINGAKAGDTILLSPDATFVGNFTLPPHAGDGYITIRSAAQNTLLPPNGVRVSPAYSPYLPKIISATNLPAIRTTAGAAYWRLMFLEVGPGRMATGDLLDLGDGSAAQNQLSQVPHHLIVDRVYVHGHPVNGQKRGIGLNSADTTIVNSYVSDIKAVGFDTQAIGGWNGPGPYRIENNYLEASTEVVLFGGDDPKINGLVAENIIVRGNTLTRPRAWRDPVLATPTAVHASAAPAGNLAAGTYAYRVVARRYIGSTQIKSAAALEVPVTVTAGSRITIEWNPVPDATDYLVYGRTPAAQNAYWTVTTASFTDDGFTGGSAGTPSSTASMWQVKNLFELKNARHVQVDFNVMENNWAQAQAGTAVLFTPRNQYGSCTWCVVEDVTFEYNVVRHTGAGLQVLGYDNLNPSQQTNGIRVRNNEFSDIDKSVWGGSGYFVTMTGGPRDLTFDHNTIVSPNGGGVIMVDGAAVSGLAFTNNVARHNAYGIMGGGRNIGNGTIAFYFPGAVILRNVLAGGKAGSYPAGNLFPTLTEFQAHFADYAAGNFSLVHGTDWERSGTDGLDLGADMRTLRAARTPMPADPPHVMTTTLPATTEAFAYATTLQASGGVLPYRWSVIDGTLPDGITLDSVTGAVSGNPAVQGDSAFTVEVRDATDAAAATPLSIHVIPAVAIETSVLAGATATLDSAQALQATGGLGTYTWAVTGGALPAGLTLSANGLLSGTPAVPGTYMFDVTAFDATDAARAASRTMTLFVAPPPNKPPTVSISSPADRSAAQVGSTVTLAALAADVDGSVQRVDFYLDDAPIGTVTTAPFTMSWIVPTSGIYRFSAVATDDRGDSTATTPVTIGTRSEIVLYASQATKTAGNYQLVADVTAAGGVGLWNPDLATAKVGAAAATPATYAEFTFYAEAGRAYHLWIRGKAQKNSWANDSIFVQFSGSAAARIGSTASMTMNLEDDANIGVSGWGWQDNGYGLNVLGANVVFETTGPQTIRIQPREDGLTIDQIVLSPDRFLVSAPGGSKNDSTIVSN